MVKALMIVSALVTAGIAEEREVKHEKKAEVVLKLEGPQLQIEEGSKVLRKEVDFLFAVLKESVQSIRSNLKYNTEIRPDLLPTAGFNAKDAVGGKYAFYFYRLEDVKDKIGYWFDIKVEAKGKEVKYYRWWTNDQKLKASIETFYQAKKSK